MLRVRDQHRQECVLSIVMAGRNDEWQEGGYTHSRAHTHLYICSKCPTANIKLKIVLIVRD